jgi:hypothetical protein
MPRLGGTHVVGNIGIGEWVGISHDHSAAANTIAKHISPITIHTLVALMTSPSRGWNRGSILLGSAVPRFCTISPPGSFYSRRMPYPAAKPQGRNRARLCSRGTALAFLLPGPYNFRTTWW